MTSQGSKLIRLAEDASEALLRAQGGSARVLVPGAQVLTSRVRLPGKQRARLLRALPYAMEEQLACDVDAQHFALGQQPSEAGDWPVAVVADERMQAWQAQLADSALELQGMTPDYLALPLSEGRWSLLLEADGALLRCSLEQGSALPLTDLPILLGLALNELEEGERPQGLDLYLAPGVAAPSLDALAASLNIEHHGEVDVMALFERGLGEGAVLPLNLLQGPYSRSERLGRLWRPWRAAAAMLAFWLLLQGGLSLHQLSLLGDELQRLETQSQALFAEAMPGRRLVLGQERRLMENALEELRGGGGAGLNRLLGDSAPLLKAQTGLELRGLRYKQGALELDLKLKDLPSLDQLKGALSAEGLRVETLSATSSGDRVESRIEIRGGGA